MPAGSERNSPRSRWSSFVADPEEEKPHILCEQGNPAHRLRVEHNETTLVHLSGEDGKDWTVFAVDRATRRCVVAQPRRQRDAGEGAYSLLYEEQLARRTPTGSAFSPLSFRARCGGELRELRAWRLTPGFAQQRSRPLGPDAGWPSGSGAALTEGRSKRAGRRATRGPDPSDCWARSCGLCSAGSDAAHGEEMTGTTVIGIKLGSAGPL
jgi:hypothetical protein